MQEIAFTSRLTGWLQRRLPTFQVQLNQVHYTLPRMLARPRRIAVIGGGLAGLTAASYLAERGYHVTLLEKNHFLGGKVGSWRVSLPGGLEAQVEHGFHAFFRQYYNLRRLLEKVGAAAFLTPIHDYTVLTEKYGRFSFRGLAKTPGLNLLSMMRAGVFRLREVARPEMAGMLALLRYDGEESFSRFDGVSFAEFARDVGLPPRLRLLFTTFSRAFFAEAEEMSMAELLKGFHFYFLSNNKGLLYDYLCEDFSRSLLGPFSTFLEQHDVDLQLQCKVERLERAGQGFEVNGALYDGVILALDLPGIKEVAQHSSLLLREAPDLCRKILHLKTSKRYAVWRLWMDGDIREDGLPGFVFTDRRSLLDSVSFYHRMQGESREWARATGGGVFELHSYVVPDHLEEEEVKARLFAEFLAYFPELKGVRVLYEHFQLRRDFSSFHKDLYQHRPPPETFIRNLYLAGDWVHLPCPAMLMEAACTSGLLCANHFFREDGLQEEPVLSVPLRGFLARR